MGAILALIGSGDVVKVAQAARLLALHAKLIVEAEQRLQAAAEELKARHERGETITDADMDAAEARILARDARIEAAVQD